MSVCIPRQAATRKPSAGVKSRSPHRRAPLPRPLVPPPAPVTPELSAAAEKLATQEIAFVGHPEFVKRQAERWIESLKPAEHRSDAPASSPAAGVVFVSGLVKTPLLTPDEERYFFLQMNYLKFRAERLRRNIDPERLDADLVAHTQQLLVEAERLRNRIVEANLRLVVAVAKKFARTQHQLGELVSEGMFPLLRAVELFDVHRGFRFSTYATWAVRNQLLRLLHREQASREVFSGDVESVGDQQPAAQEPESADLTAVVDHRELLTRLLETLPERERQILECRFGINGQPSGQSLAGISRELGLSKERVRQLVLRAIEKVRAAVSAGEISLPESWSWSVEV